MGLNVGETVDRYTVEGLCGQGAMGEVYAALDTRLRRRVALKVLRANDARPDAVARLFREARAAAALSHPNTVAIHDLIEKDNTVTIVMELVSGKPLREHIGDMTIPMVRRVEWLVAMARALGAAHRAGIVHRDIKPPNVMITEDGTVKVLDFGLARPTDPMSFRTQRGYVLGTPKYMAPEQFEGREVDARSDQYSFGVVAFELLSGQHPGLPGEPRRPLDGISASLAAVVLRTMEGDPSRRYETMDDVAIALEDRTIDQAPSTAPAPAPDMNVTDVDQRIPASFAQRLAALERVRPHMQTLTSRQVPTGMNLPRPVTPLASAPANVAPLLDATLKSSAEADSARAGIAEALGRRKPSALPKTEPMAPPMARHGRDVAEAMPTPSAPVPTSGLAPAVVVLVIVLAGFIAGVAMYFRLGSGRQQPAPAAPTLTVAAAPSTPPTAVPVEPIPLPTPLPAPSMSAAPKSRPKPSTSPTAGTAPDSWGKRDVPLGF